MYEPYYTDSLMHHGIKGMHWGIRRYQNKDGSLTPEGKKRYYNPDGSLTEKGRKRFYTRKHTLTKHGRKYNESNERDFNQYKDRVLKKRSKKQSRF